MTFTVYPRSSYPFYIVTYYIKWVTTSWTDGILNLVRLSNNLSECRIRIMYNFVQDPITMGGDPQSCYIYPGSYLCQYPRQCQKDGSGFLPTKMRLNSEDHGIYIGWYLINRCARKEQSLLFDLYKAFD